MRIYADHPDRRARQLIGDALAVAALIAAVPAGRAIYGWLDQYDDAGQSLNDSSQALAGNLHNAADRLARRRSCGDSHPGHDRTRPARPVSAPLTQADVAAA